MLAELQALEARLGRERAGRALGSAPHRPRPAGARHDAHRRAADSHCRIPASPSATSCSRHWRTSRPTSTCRASGGCGRCWRASMPAGLASDRGMSAATGMTAAATTSRSSDAAPLHRRRRPDRRRQDQPGAPARRELRQRTGARAGRRESVPRALLSQSARRRASGAAVFPVPARAADAGRCASRTCSSACASPTTCSRRTGCSRA